MMQDKIFEALASTPRRQILAFLSERELSAGDIAARFEMSAPAISRHLSVLRRSRLVRVRGEAQRRVYSLDTDGLDEVDRWVGQCREAWNARLDALGRHLDGVASRQTANWEGTDG